MAPTSMNRRIQHFSKSVEGIVGLAAVSAEWLHVLADEWHWARSLLRPTDRLAGCFPKLHDRHSPAPYRIVWCDEAADLYVGSCPDDSGRIELRRSDLVVYELDQQALARRVASALGLVFDFGTVEELPHTCRVGAFNPLGVDEAWVYFAVPLGPRELAATVAGLAVRHPAPFVLLTPTRSMWRGYHETLRRDGTVAALEDVIEVDDAGTFKATGTAAKIFERLCPSSSAGPVFRRKGKVRLLSFEGYTTAVIETKGCGYIEQLLANPGLPQHASDILAKATKRPELAKLAGAAGEPSLDRQTWSDLRCKYEELTEEMEDARRSNDRAEQARIDSELAALAEQMRAAKGKGGRDRLIGSASEKSRKAVCNAIDRALGDIRNEHRPLGHHLATCIELGTVLRYVPPQPIRWQL